MMKLRFILLLLLASWGSYCSGKRHIYIAKKSFKLSVIEKGDTIFQCPIAIGKNVGNKEKRGDMRTPEGTFTISSIENSSHWEHDFNDGKGMQKGAYGPFFFRLKTPPFKGIGIHGTCKPESIGTRDSEGCIRIKNKDLISLRKYIYVDMVVIISNERDEY